MAIKEKGQNLRELYESVLERAQESQNERALRFIREAERQFHRAREQYAQHNFEIAFRLVESAENLLRRAARLLFEGGGAARLEHELQLVERQVQFQNIDGMLETWEKSMKPIYSKNEHVKSLQVFTHLWGSDWTIMVITEYESLAAVEAGFKRAEEIRKEMFPDKEAWDATAAEIQGNFLGHQDDIVKEVPSLRK